MQPMLDGEGQMRVFVLDPSLEEEVLATVEGESTQRLLGDGSQPSRNATTFLRRIVESWKQLTGGASNSGSPVLL